MTTVIVLLVSMVDPVRLAVVLGCCLCSRAWLVIPVAVVVSEAVAYAIIGDHYLDFAPIHVLASVLDATIIWAIRRRKKPAVTA